MKSKTRPQTDTDDLFATTEHTEYTEKKTKSVIISENSPSKTKSNDNSVCSVRATTEPCEGGCSVVKKSSGIPWLGDIPEHWELKKLKYPLHLLTQKTDRRENPLALENIESWTGRYISTESEFDGEGIDFKSGDIIFGKLRPYLAKVYLAPSNGEAVGDFFVMHPGTECFAKYATYLMRSRDFIDIIDGSTFGSKMPRASWEFMGNLKIPLPPLPEQKAIAEYLDRKTGRIDSLISKKEKLVELLKEKRSALISHTVTKGINPKAKLKPSGVDFLSDIPENWEVKRIKHISSIRYGIGEPPAYYPEGTPLIRATNIDHGRVVRENLVYVDPSEIPSSRIVWLSAGDIIVVRSGAYTGDSAIIPKEWQSSIAGFDMVIHPTGINPSFFSYALLSGYLRDGQIFLEKMRAAQPHLNAEELGSCIVICPPLSEQKTISEYLDRETGKIDSLISRVESAIGKLKEYRSAVISAAVTGKIATTEHPPSLRCYGGTGTEYTEGSR